MNASRERVKSESGKPGASDAAPHEGGESERDRPAVVPVGARVRVLEGAWAGQVGLVTETDEKQGIRVQVGALHLWVRADDVLVVARERDRPTLRSSHRKDPKRGPSSP